MAGQAKIGEAHYSGAMTEIALGLAMAFFSVMVLAMISMGASFQESIGQAPALRDGIEIRPSARAGNGAAEAGMTANQRQVLLYHHGRFLDTQLRPFDPTGFEPAEKLAVAIDPELSLAEALAVREQLAARDLIITTLDPGWLKALEEIKP